MKTFFKSNPAFLSNVSHDPGVYLMQDDAGQVLYVGKAQDLRKRLASYARQEQHSKTAVMLSQVSAIETILTRTDKEALILEATLIKKYRPKYNVILRDDKRYPYLKVTVNEVWPRVVMTRRRNKDGAKYFGPFSSPSAMWATLKHINSLFPLRLCKVKELKEKKRPCLNYQIGRCAAPCVGKISYKNYQEQVKNVLLILAGQNKQLVRELEQKMRHSSEDLDFESAALFRDRIAAIKETLEKQVVVATHSLDQDIWGYVKRQNSFAVSVMLVRNGVMNGYLSYFLPEPLGTDAEILSEVLRRYYGGEHPVPKEILLPFKINDQQLVGEWLADLRGTKVSLQIPQRGNRFQLLKMAEANALKVFDDEDKKERSWDSLANALQKKLGLVTKPEHIECLDISNTGGKQSVGALVSYVRGVKEKSNYRHYAIRTVEGPDDYASMAEVLSRRFKEGVERQDMPDLLVLDGGKGQLMTAYTVLDERNLLQTIDLVSIAKEKKDEGEKIFKPGRKNPILFKRNEPILLFIMQLRDEAHRYGITFHRTLRQKKSLASPLDAIPGLGPARKIALLKTLGSVKRIKEASVDILEKVPGVGKELARDIYENLHQK
jgi:excinuclease ABC subunit C